MALSKLQQDLTFIQQLGDNPNADNNLTAAELKAWFDKAPLAIQEYVNTVLLPELDGRFKDLDDLTEQVGNIVIGSGFLPLPIIGSTEPKRGPILWFNTAGRGESGTALLALSEDASACVVQANVDGRDYGVENASVGSSPTEKTYDFTVL